MFTAHSCTMVAGPTVSATMATYDEERLGTNEWNENTNLSAHLLKIEYVASYSCRLSVYIHSVYSQP